MKYSKYIIWRLIGPFVLICFSLTGIAWLTQSLRFIDLIVNRGLKLSTFFYFSSLIIPSLLWVIVPIALFISVIFVYNKMTNDSELTVLKTSGINWIGLIKPALVFAGIATVLSYSIAFYLLPASYREFKDMQAFIRDNYAALLLQEGVFTSPANGLTVYIRERSEDGYLRGLLVYDNRSEDKSVTMMAETGSLVKSPAGPRFILINGNRQEIDKKTGQFQILYFEKYALDLSLFATNANYNRVREPEERYMSELFFPSDNINDTKAQRLRAEGHHRIIWPIYNVLLTLIALMSFIVGDYSRYGQTRKIISCIIIASGIIIWEFFTINLISGKPSLTLLPYVITILSVIMILWVMSDHTLMYRVRRYVKKVSVKIGGTP